MKRKHERREQSSGSHCHYKPAPAPIDNKGRFFEDHSEDVLALRAERDPDADLARTVARRS